VNPRPSASFGSLPQHSFNTRRRVRERTEYPREQYNNTPETRPRLRTTPSYESTAPPPCAPPLPRFSAGIGRGECKAETCRARSFASPFPLSNVYHHQEQYELRFAGSLPSCGRPDTAHPTSTPPASAPPARRMGTLGRDWQPPPARLPFRLVIVEVVYPLLYLPESAVWCRYGNGEIGTGARRVTRARVI
jgi:hypothetical protein